VREVVLYGRPGCHLCEDALTNVQRVAARVRFTLTEVDIERDDALMLRFLERIPVVTIDGEEKFELFVPEEAFEHALSRGV
jgi:glutaredoxin